MGWYPDGRACSARTALLAPQQPCNDGHMACVRDPSGTCYFYQGGDLDFLQGGRLRKQTWQELGHHTGGKTERANRIEAWTSYRGKRWEKNQGRPWDISQRVEL